MSKDTPSLFSEPDPGITTTRLDPPRPGLYKGVDYDTYSRWDAASSSILKLFKRSALHARWEQLNPKDPTPALAFGNAFHKAVLEPDTFKQAYLVAPHVDKRTKAGKQAWADFQLRCHASKALAVEDYEFSQIEAMQQAVYAHPIGKQIFSEPGVNEMCAVWIDKVTGAPCKLRADRFMSLLGYSSIIDLKSTENAHRDSFMKDIAKFQYAEQAAFYIDGFNTLVEKERRFVLVAVEKDPPYGVAVYELDDLSIAEGRRRYRKHLRMFAEARKSNVWKSYDPGLNPINLPPWELRSSSEGIDE